MTHQNELAAYMAQLNPLEQKVLQIAASHLETSFSLVKSIGFLEWQHKQAEQNKQPAPEKAQPAPEQPQKIKVKKKLTPRVI